MNRLVKRTLWCLIAVVLPGCGLTLDFDPPGGFNLECFVTVRNPDGVEVTVSSVNHEDFLNSRRYFECVDGRCPTTCSRRTIPEAAADWRIWARREIERVSADPSSTSTFRLAGGPWCEVPGSLRCERREALAGTPPCDDITGPDLCTAPPVVAETCVEVSCPGPDCTAIDFGRVPVSDRSAPTTVTVANCGTADVRAQIDPDLSPIGPRGDFVVSGFDCGPRNPDEMLFGRILQAPPGDSTCSFGVQFSPEEPFEHAARKIFWSEADPSHTIDLTGFGIGGGLVDDAPPLICLEETVPCTARRRVTLRNAGPGVVVVRDVRTTAPNFEVETVPPTVPIDLIPGDPPFEVLVRWCAGPPGALTGQLVIETSERTLFVDLETRPTCP